MITLPPNEQNSALVCTYSILVALSRPSNGQNFTSPPLTSSNQLHKCYKNVLLNISHGPLPPIHMVLFRFRSSKLNARFRQLAFVF